MKKKFIKPNWYPSADIIANKQGWVYTKNHNEVLSAIARLDTRIAAEEALNIQPMIVTPSNSIIAIESVSDLEIDWGDGTIQTITSGTSSLMEYYYNVTANIYEHKYEDTFEGKVISIKHLDGTSPIEFFRSDAIKEVQQWYSAGYKPTAVSSVMEPTLSLLAFYGLGPDLTTVPNIAPPNTTNLSGLFRSAAIFNQDISSWNVSNVTNMYMMFREASSFNQDISSWNVSNVTDMTGMFLVASSFNQPLNDWNVSSVTNMSYMFYVATAFDQDLSQWCVPLITSLPSDFATDAVLFTPDKFPVWGTCPRGENLVI